MTTATKRTANEERILKALSRGACLTTAQLTERTGMAVGGCRTALKRLEDEGLIIGWKAHPKDREFLWATENPQIPTIAKTK